MRKKKEKPFSLQHVLSRKTLLFASSLFIITLIASSIVTTLNGVSIFAIGTPDKVVSNETELKNAVNNTSSKEAIVALNNDIILTETLKIPSGKDITLRSNKAMGYYKLIGVEGVTNLVVESNGVLKLDGIIVTHVNGSGRGVSINSGGVFIMFDGEISGNSGVAQLVSNGQAFGGDGGGVYNSGTFEMYGGKIFNNTATAAFSTAVTGYGGGVYNNRFFTMYDGVISNNTALGVGGGVYNSGTFNRLGGTISNNRAGFFGHDVYSHDADNGGSTGDGSGSSNDLDGSGGNGDGSSNGNGGSGGNGSSSVGFSLSDVVFICVIVVVVVVGAVAGALFFYFKKKVAHVEAKFNTLTQDKTEE